MLILQYQIKKQNLGKMEIRVYLRTIIMTYCLLSRHLIQIQESMFNVSHYLHHYGKSCNLGKGSYSGSVVVEWCKALDWRCKGRGLESRHGTNLLWLDINLNLLLYIQVLNEYPVGCDRHCWSNSFWASSNAWLECSPGSGDCAHSVCGQALNPMSGVIVYL